MATLLTAKQIVEQALRKIGSYSINDTGADPVELEEGLVWLDLIMSELSGTEHVKFLVSQAIEINLLAGQQTYNLKETAGAAWPKDDMAFPLSLFVSRSSGDDQEVKLIDRAKFDVKNSSTDSGDPEVAHIERNNDPAISFWPVPSRTTTVRLTIQTFAPTVMDNINAKTNLRLSWQRWAIYALSVELGNGTVRKLPSNEVDSLKRDAAVTKRALLNFDRSFENEAPVMPFYG